MVKKGLLLSVFSALILSSPAQVGDVVAPPHESVESALPHGENSPDGATEVTFNQQPEMVEQEAVTEEHEKKESHWKEGLRTIGRWLPTFLNCLFIGAAIVQLCTPLSLEREPFNRSNFHMQSHERFARFNTPPDVEYFFIEDPATRRVRLLDAEKDAQNIAFFVELQTPPPGAVLFSPYYPSRIRWEEDRESFQIQEQPIDLEGIGAAAYIYIGLILSVHDKLAKEEWSRLSEQEREQLSENTKERLDLLTTFVKDILKKRQKVLDDEYASKKSVKEINWRRPFISYVTGEDKERLKTLLLPLCKGNESLMHNVKAQLNDILTHHITKKLEYVPPYNSKVPLSWNDVERILKEKNRKKKIELLAALLPPQSTQVLENYTRGFENFTEKETVCPLCLEHVGTLSQRPMLMLPCGHFFCDSCLQEQVDSATETKHKYLCGACRSSFSNKNLLSFVTPRLEEN